MAGTVTVAIDSGALLVEDGVLHVGELAPLEFSGYTPAEGNSVRLTLFANDGKTPLADNHSDAATLDLRGEKLRKAFRERRGNMVFYAVATEFTAGGESTEEVLATGQVPVAWSPLVFDAETGEPASLVGPRGDTGATGASAFEIWKAQDPSRANLDEAAFIESLRGAPTAMHFVWDVETECYRQITLVEEPETGKLVIAVDEEHEYSADDVTGSYVMLGGDQTLTGKKTFSGGAEVPAAATLTVGKTPSAKTDAANKKYVDDKVAGDTVVHTSGAETLTGKKTFSGGAEVPVAATLTVGKTPSANTDAANKKYVDDKVAGNTVVHTSEAETLTGKKTFNGGAEVPAAATLTVGKTPSANTDAANKKYVDDKVAGDTVVHTSGAETIGGAKTFSDGIVIPTGKDITLTDAPSANTDAANKKYVDDTVGDTVDALPGVLVATKEITPTTSFAAYTVTVPQNKRFRCVGVFYCGSTSTTVWMGESENATNSYSATTNALGIIETYLSTGEGETSLAIYAKVGSTSYVKKIVVFVFQAPPAQGS